MKRDLPRDRPPPLKIPRPRDPHHHQALQPQLQPQQQQQHAHAPFRPSNPNYRQQPVIIHTYSPEVIQIDSDNFRQLVQRLTGPAAGSQASPHAPPPPPKRPRIVGVPPPTTGSFNPNNHSYTQGNSSLISPTQIAPHRVPSPPPPRGLRGVHQDAANPYLETSSGYGNLPHNPLLSPSFFDFSPSVLPSVPSTFSFVDFPSIASPPMGLQGGRGLQLPMVPRGAGLYSPIATGGVQTAALSLAAALPSPGPLSAGFLADLPVLSPAAYSWIEKNAASADAILSSSRAGLLPPRPPPTTTANLFPSALRPEGEKPFLYGEK